MLSFLPLQGLLCDLQKTKEAFLENSTLSDQLPQPEERSTPGLHSGQRHSLQTAAYLEKMLLARSNEFEVCPAFSAEWRLWTALSLESCEAVVLFGQDHSETPEGSHPRQSCLTS